MGTCEPRSLGPFGSPLAPLRGACAVVLGCGFAANQYPDTMVGLLLDFLQRKAGRLLLGLANVHLVSHHLLVWVGDLDRTCLGQAGWGSGHA